MATSDTVLDRVLRRLGQLKPSPRSILLYTSDGEKKTIAVNERRRKWTPVRKLMESYKWERLEALNEKGDIVDAIENDAEDDYGLPYTDEGVVMDRDVKLLSLMLKAQDVALRRDKERQEVMVAHLMKLVELVMGRLTAIEKDNMSHLRRISDLMLEQSEDEDGNSSMSGPMLANLIGMWQNMPSQPAPTPKANGKKAAPKSKPG